MLKLLANPYVILFAVLSLAGAFIGFGAWIHQNTTKIERAACSAEKKAALDEAQKINQTIRNRKEAIKHETQNLDRSGIIDELCINGWVRNANHCPTK